MSRLVQNSMRKSGRVPSFTVLTTFGIIVRLEIRLDCKKDRLIEVVMGHIPLFIKRFRAAIMRSCFAVGGFTPRSARSLTVHRKEPSCLFHHLRGEGKDSDHVRESHKGESEVHYADGDIQGEDTCEDDCRDIEVAVLLSMSRAPEVRCAHRSVVGI